MLTVNKVELAAINEKLKTMSTKVGKSTVRKAARKAMIPVRDEVRANAPVDVTDPDNIRLKDNIAIVTKWRGDELKVRVGIRGGGKQNDETPWYFRFQEFGTKEIPARPFMEPALASNAQEILDQVAAELTKAIFQ